MQFCRTRKKGMGFLDFFSILAYAFVILVFYLLIKLTLGKATFQIPEESGNVADTISLINILKTPVEINNSKMSIAELIALSRFDSSKNQLAEKSIMQIMDDYFGNKCSIFCIDGEKLKSRGCSSLQHFGCSENVISVPAYGAAIEVAFKSDIAQPSTKNIPLK